MQSREILCCRTEFGVEEEEMPALVEEVEICYFCACKTVAIAGLRCRLHGPAGVFENKFVAFETTSLSEEDKLQNLYVRLGTPTCRENGEVLLRNRYSMRSEWYFCFGRRNMEW